MLKAEGSSIEELDSRSRSTIMPESIQELVDIVEESQVRFLRFGWVDNAGVYRAHAIRASRIAKMASDGLGLATGAQAVPVHEDVVAERQVDLILRHQTEDILGVLFQNIRL